MSSFWVLTCVIFAALVVLQYLILKIIETGFDFLTWSFNFEESCSFKGIWKSLFVSSNHSFLNLCSTSVVLSFSFFSSINGQEVLSRQFRRLIRSCACLFEHSLAHNMTLTSSKDIVLASATAAPLYESSAAHSEFTFTPRFVQVSNEPAVLGAVLGSYGCSNDQGLFLLLSDTKKKLEITWGELKDVNDAKNVLSEKDLLLKAGSRSYHLKRTSPGQGWKKICLQFSTSRWRTWMEFSALMFATSDSLFRFVKTPKFLWKKRTWVGYVKANSCRVCRSDVVKNLGIMAVSE